MNNNESLAHAKWDRACHIVRMPKHGRKVLYGECGEEIGDVPGMLAGKKGVPGIAEGGVCRDRIHPCIRIAPKYAVAKAMGHLKGKGALMLFGRHPEWRKATERYRTLWARGCLAPTVGVSERGRDRGVRARAGRLG